MRYSFLLRLLMIYSDYVLLIKRRKEIDTTMKNSLIQIPLNAPLVYHMSGKFEAPSDSWMHEDFDLTDFELILMTDDVLYLEYNHVPFTVHPGEYLLLPPFPAPDNRRKGLKASNCSFYWIHFSSCAPHALLSSDAFMQANEKTVKATKSDTTNTRKEADNFASDANSICIPVQGTTPNPAKLIALMKQLQSNVRDGHCHLALNYETTSLVCELYSQLTKEDLDADKLAQKQIYSDMLDYIKLNRSNNLRVSDIALHFGYNEKYLSHLFRQLSGVPLKQFILKSKMDEASYLLTDTNLSIGEIAVTLGYTDAHNFARTYKKCTGLSPSAYRESYAKRLLYHV